MDPVLLDASFLIALEHEIEAGVAGPAVAWLRRQRSLASRALLVSCVSVAEFLEGCADAKAGTEFVARFIPQGMGFQHATKCAEIQRRAAQSGRRWGENDAWQVAFAERAKAVIVGRDRRAFSHLGRRYERFD